MTHPVTRRCILSATGVALAVPHLAQASTPDPLVPLYREWLSARREWRALSDLPGNEDWDDPRSIAAELRENRAAAQMLDIEPSSPEGIAALVALAWYYVHPGTLDPEEFAFQAETIECRALTAIWRACTGKDGYPEV